LIYIKGSAVFFFRAPLKIQIFGRCGESECKRPKGERSEMPVLPGAKSGDTAKVAQGCDVYGAKDEIAE
jgi:hypothetical protein